MLKYQIKARIASVPVEGLRLQKDIPRWDRGSRSRKEGNKQVNNSIIPQLRSHSHCYAEYEIARSTLANRCFHLRTKHSRLETARILDLPVHQVSHYTSIRGGFATRNNAYRQRDGLTQHSDCEGECWAKSVEDLINLWHLTFTSQS